MAGSVPIPAHYLRRKAMVYARQSSDRQVQNNTGSTADQRNQVRYAKEEGWREDMIDLNDEDLGQSGTGTVNRAGYQRMVAEIVANLIGAVFVSDLSRLGRDPVELLYFLELCRRHDVLLFVDGRITDLADSAQLFSQKILSLVTEFEGTRRRDMMERGKVAKVKAGKVVTNPPRGYVRGADGRFVLDPDPSVQESIRAVFRTFFEERSIPRTARAMRRQGIKLPKRLPGGQIEWVPPTGQSLYAILKNPNYTGDYHFRLQRVDPAKGRAPNGEWRRRRARAEETTVVPDLHDSYITHEAFNEIQAVMKLNAPSQERRNLGPGSALLQGFIYCAHHPTRVMSPAYSHPDRNGRTSHVYRCEGDYFSGGKVCQYPSGIRLDHAVTLELFKRLATPSLGLLKEAWERALEEAEGGDRLLDRELRSARQEVEQAKRRCLAVDPNLRHVAQEYEVAWEAAKHHLEELERTHASRTQDVVSKFSEETWGELIRLAADLSLIWDAPTTAPRDRKEIARTLIDLVICEGHDKETIRVRIVWKDGSPDTRLEVRMPAYAHKRIEELAAEGLKPKEIAQKLNDEGLLTTQGRSWGTETVQRRLWVIRNRKPKAA